jgi:hydroxymethylbilane synthase
MQALRIGTRGSPLALVQAGAVKSAILAAGGAERDISVRRITTTGDRETDRPLAELGGKGLFTKEIDGALLAGEVDCAVHSMKDMDSVLPDGVVIAAVLPRSDPRDCLIGRKSLSLADLPRASRLGTSAVRRRAQALHLRPDLTVLPLRGNVETRLVKQERGDFDAIILAKAGLDRLARTDVISYVFAPDEILPAAGQGVIAVIVRAQDEPVRKIVAAIDHEETRAAAEAERAFTARLCGNCRTPIAAFASLKGAQLSLEGAIFSLDGGEFVRGRIDGDISEAAALGMRLADRLRGKASPGVLAALDED